MELRQLEYLVAVVEEGSFTRAAQRERVAQPAVSAQIQRLERQVGQPLLTRSRRDVRLTQAGAAMLPHARAALAAVRAAQQAVDEVASLVRGTVAIGTVTLHPVDVAGLMAEFHVAHPGVEISLRTDNSDVLLAELADGRLDAAIVSIAVDETPGEVDCAVITDEIIEPAVSTGHPLHARKTVTLQQLCEHPLISLPSGTGLRSRLDTACCGRRIAAPHRVRSVQPRRARGAGTARTRCRDPAALHGARHRRAASVAAHPVPARPAGVGLAPGDDQPRRPAVLRARLPVDHRRPSCGHSRWIRCRPRCLE